MNKKIIFVMQPTYLPWIGIFKAIDLCDDFVFYDDVQFEKQSWQQRNKIINRSDFGKPFVYLSVPVAPHHLKTPITEIFIKDPEFYHQHLNLIRINYAKKRYLEEVANVLKEVYSRKFTKLCELNIALIEKLAAYLGLSTNFHNSSELHTFGAKSERLVNIAEFFHATAYLSALGAKEYLNANLFLERGIEVTFLEFFPPPYPQGKTNFLSQLSVIDALIHLGPLATRDMIRSIQIL